LPRNGSDIDYDLFLSCGKRWWKLRRENLRSKCEYFAGILPPVDPVRFILLNISYIIQLLKHFQVNPRMIERVHGLDPEKLACVIQYLEEQGEWKAMSR
jgi:hypothetical protein